MLKEIPNKPNHKIIGYKEIPSLDGKLPSLYEPIYEKIFPLNKVYWDNSRNERIYLTSDTQGFDCEGHFVSINVNNFENCSKADQEMFYELLSLNGYEIKDGKLALHLNYGGIYMTNTGVIVIYLADGCHTCTNEIVDYKIIRPADTFETEAFYDCLKKNGFEYSPTIKYISKVERYYYFPSYSLYKGFQPKKKEWINSDVDKFFAKHFEMFDTFNECAGWCNILNEALERDYPEIKLEE